VRLGGGSWSENIEKWGRLAGCGGGTVVRPWRLKEGKIYPYSENYTPTLILFHHPL